MAASGVTSTINPSPVGVGRPSYDPQASLDALRTWCGFLVEFQRQAESKGGRPLPHSPATSLRPTPTAAPTSPRASTSGKPRSAIVYGPRTSAVTSDDPLTPTDWPPPCSPPSREGSSSPRFTSVPPPRSRTRHDARTHRVGHDSPMFG